MKYTLDGFFFEEVFDLNDYSNKMAMFDGNYTYIRNIYVEDIPDLSSDDHTWEYFRKQLRSHINDR